MSRLNRNEWIFLGLVAVFVFALPFSDVATTLSNNAAYYLDEGKRLLNGEPPRFYRKHYVARGPLFAYFVASVLWLFGSSITAVYFAMKIIFVLFIATAFCLARSLFKSKTAYITAAFIALSPELYKIGTMIDTTGLQTCFIFLFLFFFGKMLRSGKIIDAILAGGFWGASYLTKETSLLLAAMVLFFFFISIRNRKRVYLIGLVLITFFVTLIPWGISVYRQSGSLLPLLGHFNPEFIQHVSETRLGNSLTTDVGTRLREAATHLWDAWIQTSWLIPLAILSFLASAWKSCRAPNSSSSSALLMVVLSILCLTPVPLSGVGIGALGDTNRHAFFIYGLLFILLANHLTPILERVASYIPQSLVSPRRILSLGILLIGIILCAFTLFKKSPALAQKFTYSKYLINYSPLPRIQGRFTPPQREAAQFLERRFSPGTVIVCDGTLIEIVSFDTGKTFQLKSFPQLTPLSQRDASTPPLYLRTAEGFQTLPDVRRSLFYGEESDLLSSLEIGTVVAFLKSEDFLWQYFSDQEWVELTYENQEVVIFDVKRLPSQKTSKMYFHSDFYKDLSWYQSTHPEEFEKIEPLLRKWNALSF